MQPFELRGPGLLLSTARPDDIDRITALCQDPSIQRWVTVPVPYTRDNAISFVTESVPTGWESGRELTWAIRDPEDRRLLGMIGLTELGGRTSEIGYWLAPAERGQGLVTAAVRLVAQYAFAPEGKGSEYLRWRAIAGNWESRRVAWATGFHIEPRPITALVNHRGEPADGWLGTLTVGEPMRPRHPWLTVPALVKDSVALRTFDPTDADAVVEACSDPQTQYWLAHLPSPYTHDDATIYLEGQLEAHAAATALHVAAAPADGGAAMGAFALNGLRIGDRAELGYWVHPDARGTGVATTAAGLLIGHAFRRVEDGGMGLRRIVVTHSEGNDASRKVIERSGFRRIGVERAAAHLRGGGIVDTWRYDLLADDWRG